VKGQQGITSKYAGEAVFVREQCHAESEHLPVYPRPLVYLLFL
jgi:hypothetical protein